MSEQSIFEFRHAIPAFLAGALFTLVIRETFFRPREIKYSSKEDGAPRKEQDAIAAGIESTIGNTPLFAIKSLSAITGCPIMAKAEFMTGAGGSPKDRVALSIIQSAEEAGLLTPHSGD